LPNQGPNYGLQSKDITEDGKKVFVKDINPLDPRYVMSTKSGRKNIFGIIDNNKKGVSGTLGALKNNSHVIEKTYIWVGILWTSESP
jgi:hypothetical protein